MKINNRSFKRLGGFAIASITRQWMSTLDYQAAYYHRQVDPVLHVIQPQVLQRPANPNAACADDADAYAVSHGDLAPS